MVTSFVSFWDAYWLIVIVNRIGEGWQEKNGLLTCPYWGIFSLTGEFLKRYTL